MTYNEYLSAMLARLPDSYQKSPGFPVYDIIAACALAAVEISDEISDAKSRLYLDNLTGDELDAYVRDRSGLERIDGDFAYGSVIVYGNGEIPAGTLFSTEAGLTFESTEAVYITDEGEVSVCATDMGSLYNVAENTVTRFPVTVQGLTSVTNTEAITGGADRESDDSLRERYREKMSEPPINGNIYAYREWALSVDGVGGVKVIPLGHGPGTVDIKIVNASGAEPSDELIKAVQDYIDPDSSGKGEGIAPIGAACYVSAAEFTAYDLSGKVILDGSREESEVDAELKQEIGQVFSTAFSDNVLRYSSVVEAIMHTAGVKRFTTISLGGEYTDIALKDNTAAKLGKWSVTYGYE